MHFLVQVGHLHAGLGEVAELLRQVRQQVLQVGRRAWLAVTPHRYDFPELVVQGRVDGADGVFAAKERLAPCKERKGQSVLQLHLLSEIFSCQTANNPTHLQIRRVDLFMVNLANYLYRSLLN